MPQDRVQVPWPRHADAQARSGARRSVRGRLARGARRRHRRPGVSAHRDRA